MRELVALTVIALLALGWSIVTPDCTPPQRLQDVGHGQTLCRYDPTLERD